MLRHKDCHGTVVAILPIRLVSPGLRLTTNGIQSGVAEHRVLKCDQTYSCLNCGKEFKGEQDFEEIEEMCSVCTEHKLVKEILITPYGAFCTECYPHICKESTYVDDEYFTKVKEILNVSNRTQKVPLSKLMLQSISV